MEEERAESVTRGGLKAAAALFLFCAALAGCAGQKSGTQQPVNAGPSIGVPLRLATCTDWRQADASERLGTIGELNSFAGSPVGSSTLKRGPVLKDTQAYDLLQRECAQPFARGFKLYKLYERAASFAGR